jgi:hypothetical protein
MTSVRKRVETLERSQSLRGGTASDQIVRRVLECVSDIALLLAYSGNYRGTCFWKARLWGGMRGGCR